MVDNDCNVFTGDEEEAEEDCGSDYYTCANK